MTGAGAVPSLDDHWDATLADWLAGAFAAPPSAAVVEGYRGELGGLLFDALRQKPGCREGAGAMHRAVAGTEAPDTLMRALGTAFARLFEGVGGPDTVSPFESAHASPSGRLFQSSSGAMEDRLRKASLAPSAGDHEPCDHVSVELALLARLMRRPGTAGAQLALLDDHLLAWVPGFAALLQARNGSGFYAAAASVLLGFLNERRAGLAARRDALVDGMVPCWTG